MLPMRGPEDAVYNEVIVGLDDCSVTRGSGYADFWT
jgi:hypothetical protein